MPLHSALPTAKPQETALQHWVMDIQFTNDNSRSIIFFPLKREPLPYDKRDKKWRKRFRSENIIIHAECQRDPKWDEAVYVSILKGWKAGTWRKVDLRRKADKS